MQNITLSVEDKVWPLSAGVERNSSVNALVREYLTNIAQHHDRARRARARLVQLSKKSKGQLGKKTWTRDDLHER